MPGFVITVVFDVEGGKLPLGADVLAQAWGMGHRFSYCDGRMLTLVVELTAADRAGAFEALLSRAEMIWVGLGFGSLAAPTTVRIQGAVEPLSVPAGSPGAGRSGVHPADAAGSRRSPAPAAARAAAQLRGRDGLLAELHRRRRGRLRIWPNGDPPPDPPDGGGLAGVREPRRPPPGPGGTAVEIDVPRSALTEGG